MVKSLTPTIVQQADGTKNLNHEHKCYFGLAYTILKRCTEVILETLNIKIIKNALSWQNFSGI